MSIHPSSSGVLFGEPTLAPFPSTSRLASSFLLARKLSPRQQRSSSPRLPLVDSIHPSTPSVLLIESTPSFPRIAFSSLQLQSPVSPYSRRHSIIAVSSLEVSFSNSIYPVLLQHMWLLCLRRHVVGGPFPNPAVVSRRQLPFIQIQVSSLSLYAMLDKPRLFYRLRPDSALTNPRFLSYPTPSSSPGRLLSAS